VTCAAGAATVRYLKRHRLVERCAEASAGFFAELATLAEHPAVGDVRGAGLLAGIKFVRDRATREPMPRGWRFAEKLVECAREQEGLIVWPNVGHADGTRGDLVIVAPPLAVTPEEVAEIGARLRRALAATPMAAGTEEAPRP
jgi:adenosylmethionine-8-amino-7-oxononanoate aminotransferase